MDHRLWLFCCALAACTSHPVERRGDAFEPEQDPAADALDEDQILPSIIESLEDPAEALAWCHAHHGTVAAGPFVEDESRSFQFCGESFLEVDIAAATQLESLQITGMRTPAAKVSAVATSRYLRSDLQCEVRFSLVTEVREGAEVQTLNVLGQKCTDVNRPAAEAALLLRRAGEGLVWCAKQSRLDPRPGLDGSCAGGSIWQDHQVLDIDIGTTGLTAATGAPGFARIEGAVLFTPEPGKHCEMHVSLEARPDAPNPLVKVERAPTCVVEDD